MDSSTIFSTLSVVTAVLVAVDLIVARRSVNPVRIMGYIFIALSIATPILWDGVKGLSGSGVPPNLEYGSQKYFEIACLTTSVSLLFTSTIFIIVRSRTSLPTNRISLRNFKLIPWPLSMLVIILWILGQGPSFLDKTIYLSSDGISFLNRPTALLGPIVATAIFAAELGTTRRLSKPSIVLAIIWVALLASVGSRLTMLPMSLLLLSIFQDYFGKNKSVFLKVSFSLTWIYLSVYSLLTLFYVSLVSRVQRHGLLNIPSLLSKEGAPNVIFGESWLNSYQSLVVSVSSIYPIVNISATYPMDPGTILQNANPLPSDILSLSPNVSNELILPWLPMAFLGELLGTFGAQGLALVIVFWSSVTLFAINYATAKERNLIAIFIGAAFSLALLSALQYPSRISFRFFSAVYFALLFLAFSRARSGIENRLMRQTTKIAPSK